MKPLAIDLFCGLGGWTEGFLAEGYDVVGFDIERHVYDGAQYPAQLVLQDARTIDGAQLRDAAVIVASSPCQAYSYMAMPWSRAKAKREYYRDPAYPERLLELNELFGQGERIQREASAAAGHVIPMVQENVKGAQPWVGRARWHFGSYYLWGDVPALMPIVSRRQAMKAGDRNRLRSTGGHEWTAKWDEGVKAPGQDWNGFSESGVVSPHWRMEGAKNAGGSWFAQGHPQAVHGANPDGRKVGGDWFGSYADQKAAGTISPGRLHGKGSSKRAAASAHIAKIPLALARHIAHVYHP